MSVRISSGLVISSLAERVPCPIRIREITSQTIRVSILACCYQQDEICIVQGAAKDFSCVDSSAGADYSSATEITFDIWDKKPGAAGATNLVSRSLSGITITVANDTTFSFSISSAQSVALPAGAGWYEAWVTQAGGELRLVGAGRVRIIDMRKQDA